MKLDFQVPTKIPFEDSEITKHTKNTNLPIPSVYNQKPRYNTRSRTQLVNNMKQITKNVSICTKDFMKLHELADIADKHPAELLKEKKNFTIEQLSEILKENNKYTTE